MMRDPNCTSMRAQLAGEEGEGTKREASLDLGREQVVAALAREKMASPVSKNEDTIMLGSKVKMEGMSREILLGVDVDMKRYARGEGEAGCVGYALVKELQMKVKILEAEIEKMKKENFLQLNRKVADNDSEATTTRTRAITQVTSRKLHKVDVASDTAVAANRHISSLPDDILLQIFLHLPSVATLVRAACTCPTWHYAMASSPDFRHRFHALHPAPLLGFLFQAYDPTPAPHVPAFPLFVPMRPNDPDLVAAIRGGDFFFTSLMDCSEGPCCWEFMDGCCGYVLLMNSFKKLFTVFNPLTRDRYCLPDLETQDGLEWSPGVLFTGVLLCRDEALMSFNVVLIRHNDSRVQVTIFSSDTRMWSIIEWVDFPSRPDGDANHLLPQVNMKRANGLLYWVYEDFKYIISLDPITMKFSITELPEGLSRPFAVGKTKGGQACIVYVDEFNIGVIVNASDDNALDRWVLDRVVPLDTELERLHLPLINPNDNELEILEMEDGYVYLATTKMFHDHEQSCWFVALCLETMKLEVLFQKTFDNYVHPYIMAWPALLGNYRNLKRPAGDTEHNLHLKLPESEGSSQETSN